VASLRDKVRAHVVGVARTVVVLVAFGAASLLSVVETQAGERPLSTLAQPPAQLRAIALLDALTRGSFHENQAFVDAHSITFSDDVAITSGEQRVDVGGRGQVHIEAVGTTGYFSGNRAGLITDFGFPTRVATQVGSRWVSVPRTSGEYSGLTYDATLPTALDEIAPRGHLTQTHATIHDHAAIAIHGTAAKGAAPLTAVTLYITRAAHPLPFYASFTGPAGATATAEITNWGERVTITAPTRAIPFSSLK
jgi:hypothetical protein